MDFRVELQKMTLVPDSLKEIQKQLGLCQRELNEINHALYWQISRREQFNRRILNASGHLGEQSRKAASLAASLETIISLYMEAEKKASTDLWISMIKDEKTRKFLEEHKEYADRLRKAYEESNGTARELYDKYRDRIKIATMNSDASYCLGDELYLNHDKNINDPRGTESVYYHETGHWIVNEEGWISDGEMSPEFQKFDQAVKEDVRNYIAQIEARQRAKYEGQYSGDALEAMITKQTKAYLHNELGGKNSDVLDGVSDMIDAASNGKYQITYSHGEGYWDASPLRQASEAFAEMYSADFCNDTVETEFMKKYFPNAYKEYENLKRIAINSGK